MVSQPSRRSPLSIARALMVVGFALLLAVQVVRNAVVAQYAELQPDRAARFWSGHPAVEISEGMVQIARLARQGSPADQAAFAMIADAARKSPLSAEPFLVRGVQARVTGDERHASQAFLAAELRDGRSAPARYFLADHYLRVGNVAAGLSEIAMLARMIPNSVATLSPYVATYAQDPRNRAQVKALFRTEPELQDGTLAVLAADARNSDLVLELATAVPPGAPLTWPSRLVTTLVSAGSFARAHDVWRGAVHPAPPAGALIYDAAFKDSKAPGPFNWTLTSSSLGLAERQPGGQLHIVYDGTDNGPLAWQLLILKPGRYQLDMRVAGELGKVTSLGWIMTCETSQKQLLKVDLAAKVHAFFVVPAGCAAQRLELAGTARDLPQTADVTVSGLSLVHQGAGG